MERYKSIDAYSSTLFFSKEGYDKLLDVLKMANELKCEVEYEKIVTNKYLS